MSGRLYPVLGAPVGDLWHSWGVHRLLCLVLLSLLCTGGAPGKTGVEATVVVGGRALDVIWEDGDTLTFLSGPRKGRDARLMGFNTLESYGPVHRWGDWTPTELWQLALGAAGAAAAEPWECTLGHGKDAYGRLLLDCPKARRRLIEAGWAHVFAYDDPADPADLAAQRAARADGLGIWAKGTPETIVTSVNADEGGLVFMRVVSCRTGETRAEHQREDYQICDEICHGPAISGSCMLFVPFDRRYENRPECLEP
jgi:micrococcal nuclease